MTELEKFFMRIDREFGFDDEDSRYTRYAREDLYKEITAIPDGFTDSSWHNDCYPSLRSKESVSDGEAYLEVRIWVCPKDLVCRELGEEKRYCMSIDDSELVYSFSSDSWQDIINHAPYGLALLKIIGESNCEDKLCDPKAREYAAKHDFDFFD